MSAPIHPNARPEGDRVTVPLSARWIGLAAWLGAVAVQLWSNFGGSDHDKSQQAGTPYVVAALLVVALVLFGALVPRSVRRDRAGLSYAVSSAVLVPLAFWSGLPLMVGSAALVVARSASSTPKATRIVAVVAMCATVAMAILGNTVLA